VGAYLTAVAEDDTDALCDVTTPEAVRTISDDSGDVCGTDDDELLRTCADARAAVAALEADAVSVPRGGGAVTIDWAPETAPSCDDATRTPALPARVEEVDGRWQVTAVERTG
jgi:hypothetical protein